MTDPGNTIAAARVFAIPELLENVLTCLVTDEEKKAAWPSLLAHSRKAAPGLRTLYRLQGVSKAFRDVISDSKELRRIVFRESPPEKHQVDERAEEENLERILSEDFGEDDSTEHLNPLLACLFNSVYSQDGILLFFISAGSSKSETPPLSDFMSGSVASHKAGSWRHALINSLSVPIRIESNVTWILVIGAAGSSVFESWDYELRAGATLADLTDILATDILDSRKNLRRVQRGYERRQRYGEVRQGSKPQALVGHVNRFEVLSLADGE